MNNIVCNISFPNCEEFDDAIILAKKGYRLIPLHPMGKGLVSRNGQQQHLAIGGKSKSGGNNIRDATGVF